MSRHITATGIHSFTSVCLLGRACAIQPRSLWGTPCRYDASSRCSAVCLFATAWHVASCHHNCSPTSQTKTDRKHFHNHFDYARHATDATATNVSRIQGGSDKRNFRYHVCRLNLRMYGARQEGIAVSRSHAYMKYAEIWLQRRFPRSNLTCVRS